MAKRRSFLGTTAGSAGPALIVLALAVLALAVLAILVLVTAGAPRAWIMGLGTAGLLVGLVLAALGRAPAPAADAPAQAPPRRTRPIGEARPAPAAGGAGELSERRARAMAESLPALVWMMDGAGRTIFQNQRALDFAGAPLIDREERRSIVHPDDLAELTAQREAGHRKHREYQVQLRLRRRDGVYRWHHLTSTPFGGAGAFGTLGPWAKGDEDDYWLATAVDIEPMKQAEELQARLNRMLETRVTETTEQLNAETAVRHRAERQLRHSQKMDAISRLTGGIAHDLNNKLMVISANIDAVVKHIKEQPHLRRKLLAALVASDQAAGLMSKLLAFARQRDLHPQYVDVSKHLESISDLLDRSLLSAAVEVRLEIPEDLWTVEVDPHQLETAIVNLAVNARDAMEEGGIITVEARNVVVQPGTLSDPEIWGDYVRITVEDTGRGIAPEHLDKVFEPFFTTKEAARAAGLGLSQVHGFAEQLGGTVEIASSPGHGTAVSVYLPRAELPARIGATPELEDLVDDEDVPAQSAEILLVDDEVEVALALQGMLDELGYATRIAIGADEAIEALRRRRPNLVLTDVTMPGSMDGVTLGREIRARDPGLPVVLITGNPMVVADTEFPLIQKPIASRTLHMTLQRHLAPPGPSNNVVTLFSDESRRPPPDGAPGPRHS
ncbi:MAG TPA: ATP-binding protein [Microvirga sp.]|jgi:PAS domain S-box-containing protein|nr:ATP-binding protein [Microvirga sp.]